jgi:5-methylcytosine-specific restriction endonuclease McrA
MSFIKLIIDENKIYVKESKKEINIEYKIRIFESVLEKHKLLYIKYLKGLPYKEYLKSKHWIETKNKILLKYHYRCQLCNNNKLLEVHHNNYENIGEEIETDLILLCKKCHSKYHNKE